MAQAAIGVVSGILGIVQFGVDNFAPTEDEVRGAGIQLRSGLRGPDPEDTHSDAGGKVISVVGYDRNNKGIGGWESGEGKDGIGFPEGGFIDITIDQSEGEDGEDAFGKDAEFINVQFSADAVCLAWASVKQLSGVDAAGGAWTGDVPAACGDEFSPMVYASNIVAGTTQNGEPWEPHCMWFDGDHAPEPDNKYASMKFRPSAYSPTNAEKTIQDQKACDNVVYSPEQVDMTDTPGQRSKRNNATNPLEKPRPDWVANTIVKSDHHSATELCQHPKTWGPDMISYADCTFCDMETKETKPLCSCNPQPGCYEVEGQKLKKRAIVAKRDVDLELREYKYEQNWQTGSDSKTKRSGIFEHQPLKDIMPGDEPKQEP